MRRLPRQVPGFKSRARDRRPVAASVLWPGLVLAALVALTAAGGCGRKDEPARRDLRIFHAAGFTPVLDAVREDAGQRLGIRLLPEASGSQVACRKLTELGRQCNLIILADSGLVTTLLKGTCSWRLDFATDEMVLGVGIRAANVDEAETDWPSVLLKPEVRLARADENLCPVGFRTLLVWKLQERLGSPGLADGLRSKCDKVVDDVSKLAAMLKSGDIDFAFVYRSTCIAHDIRYVELDKAVNLSSQDVDYSGAEVTFEKLTADRSQKMTIRGEPITWALSIPDCGADSETSVRFVRYLLGEEGSSVLDKNGMLPIKKPLFYGHRGAFQPFADLASYAGELK